eukprot:Skav214368  [mRNA]  locus=scaffold86:721393:727494:+ [translate_table: standard]
MRCLEAERQRQRDVLRATLQLGTAWRSPNQATIGRAWHVEQERQAAQRRAAERRRLEVHQEMQRLERPSCNRLGRRSVHPLEPHFDQEKLLELWKLRLAKDPSLRSGEAPEGKELLEVTGIPAELLGIEEWLNGTSRDKVVDIDVLEQAFLMVSGGQNFLQANFLHEAANSLATPGVMKMMLSYWLQHLQATSSMPAGECDSVLGTLPLESAPVQEPYDELTTAMPSQGSIPKDHMDGRSFKNAADSTMVATELDAKIPQQRTSVADAFRFSQSLVAGDMGPPVDEARTSLASRASVQRQDDDTWEAASQNGHHASTSSLLARNVSDPGSQTAKKISTSWQQTRTSLGSSLPMQRNADDVGVSPAKNEGDSKALAKDVQDSLEHQTASATSGGDVQKARESQASVPQDHKEQASMLTKSLYARYADISAPVAAQDMQDSPEHQTDSATSGGDVQKARESQASVPQDHKEQASMLTKSLYARYADISAPVAAQDVQDSPEHQTASATSGGHVQKARESQASVPQDHKEQASMLTKSLYARYADSSQPVAATDVQDSPEHQPASPTSRGYVQKARESQASVPHDHKEQASMLTKSLYARYADSSQPVAATDVQDSPEHQPASATSRGDVQKARESQASVPQDHKEQASMLTKSLYARYADSSAPVAAQDVQDSPEHQTASATSGGDVHQETQLEHGVAADSAELEAGDGEASEEEVFTKEQPGNKDAIPPASHMLATAGRRQWVAWFMTAQLEQEELELLNAALQPMAAQQHLSPEELAEALRSHAAKMSEEDRDQLEEWAQWALDIDADD